MTVLGANRIGMVVSMQIELLCDYASLAGIGDTPPCWGPVTLVEVTDAPCGDRVVVPACSGHRGIVKLGFYLSEGTTVDSDDTDPNLVVGLPFEDVL